MSNKSKLTKVVLVENGNITVTVVTKKIARRAKKLLKAKKKF